MHTAFTFFKNKHLVWFVVFHLLSLFPGRASSLPRLSEKALVSIITCSPTPEYEGAFGHSAIRIQDDSLRIDVAFNFGSYDKRQKGFVYKIFLGTVESSLEGERFRDFADRYKKDGRGINEYFLNLNRTQKQTLWEALNQKLINGNRFYHFKVPSENCSTQIRDLLFEQLNWDKHAPQTTGTGKTYRDIEQEDPLQNSWLHLLFNLICGPQTDKPLSSYQAAFNPTGLMALLQETKEEGKTVIQGSRKIAAPVAFKELPKKNRTQTVFILLLAASVVFSYLQYKQKKKSLWFIRLLLVLSGIFGCFVLSLILYSQIPQLSTNYNLLWALPTNLLLAFFIQKRNKWVRAWIGLTCLSIVASPIAALAVGQIIPVEGYLFMAALLVGLLPQAIPARSVRTSLTGCSH